MQPFADRPKVALLVFWASWGWGGFEVKAVKLREGALCQGLQALPRAWLYKLQHGAALLWLLDRIWCASCQLEAGRGAGGTWDHLWKTRRSVVYTHMSLDIFLAQKDTSSKEISPFSSLSSSPSLYLFHFALLSCKCMYAISSIHGLDNHISALHVY